MRLDDLSRERETMLDEEEGVMLLSRSAKRMSK